MNTCGYQVSNLEYIQNHWEDPDLNMDAVLRSGIDNPFSFSNLNGFELGSRAENPILIEEEKNTENSPPPASIPISERKTRPLS